MMGSMWLLERALDQNQASQTTEQFLSTHVEEVGSSHRALEARASCFSVGKIL